MFCSTRMFDLMRQVHADFSNILVNLTASVSKCPGIKPSLSTCVTNFKVNNFQTGSSFYDSLVKPFSDVFETGFNFMDILVNKVNVTFPNGIKYLYIPGKHFKSDLIMLLPTKTCAVLQITDITTDKEKHRCHLSITLTGTKTNVNPFEKPNYGSISYCTGRVNANPLDHKAEIYAKNDAFSKQNILQKYLGTLKRINCNGIYHLHSKIKGDQLFELFLEMYNKRMTNKIQTTGMSFLVPANYLISTKSNDLFDTFLNLFFSC